jgi:hypothetical protein
MITTSQRLARIGLASANRRMFRCFCPAEILGTHSARLVFRARGNGEFRARTIWSLSNPFTSTFNELDPLPQFKAKAKLGEFLETRFSQSF